MKMYQVIYQDDQEDIDRDNFHIAVLEMCRESRNCGCFKEKRMDSCDYMFTETENIAIAEDKVRILREQGCRRAWIKPVNNALRLSRENLKRLAA